MSAYMKTTMATKSTKISITINDIDGDRVVVEDATTGARRILGVIAQEIDAGRVSEWVPLHLDTAAVATLRDALTAWLDAPRDEGEPADAWWAWHDQDSSRWATMEEAEERCAAWVAGTSDDGPDRT